LTPQKNEPQQGCDGILKNVKMTINQLLLCLQILKTKRLVLKNGRVDASNKD
jgi:hypothetical protein